MDRLSALQKLLSIVAAFLIVFIYVSFPATKLVIDPNTQLQVQVVDYFMTTLRAGGVLLLSAILIVLAGKKINQDKKSKFNKTKKKRNR